jgi:hypothetical protein
MGDYIPDYNDLYAMHEAKQERALRKYPKCCSCKERITDDQLYAVGGKLYHEKCFNDEHLQNIEDYLED